ncbi:MAG: hypothetical protein HOH74_09025, partial [Gemmatimonadetes bacterium]|nr:hypothetical protein [Gemmatimonadota bacterium]
GILAILVMAVALVAKIITVRMVQRVHRGIARAGLLQQELLERAGVIQSKRSVQQHILKSLDQQRLDMEGRRSRLRTELEDLVEEYEKRERLNEIKRKALQR